MIRYIKLMYKFHCLSNSEKQTALGMHYRFKNHIPFYGKWYGHKIKIDK